MTLELARANMVEQQIRTWDVLDTRVLDAIRDLERERFVPEEYRRLAYADVEIPLQAGERMMHPRMEARLAQALQIDSGDAVLEIGTGSGFLTALLARLARHVTSVEIRPELAASAKATLDAEGIRNVSLFEGDGLEGWAVHAPYDAIAVTGSLPRVGDALPGQLRLGGRLFAVIGEAPAMEAVLVTRTGETQWSTESLFETVLAPLVGAEEPPAFEL